MLPGVELARRRRVHHGHEIHARDQQDGTAARRPLVWQRTEMEESAVIARQRLEEKLHRFSAPVASSSTTPSFPFSNLLISKARRERNSNNQNSSDDGGVGSQTGKDEVKRVGSSKRELCAVCLDDLAVERKLMRLPCSHQYHSDCVLPWLASHSHCPCCRTAVAS